MHRLSLYAYTGYDSKFVRDSLRSQRTRPVIKHRIFWNIDKAHNARMKGYGKRSMSKTVNSVIKRKYGDYVSSKAWNNQLVPKKTYLRKELVMVSKSMVTDKACIQSGKCPERGIAPDESCSAGRCE